MQVVRVRPDLRRRPLDPGRPPVSPLPAAYRARLGIAYRITNGQLRGTVEIACHTKTTQASTTLLGAGRLDGVSRRLLLQALLIAARQGPCARLHVFAVAARDLFRHVSKTLPPYAGHVSPLAPVGGADCNPRTRRWLRWRNDRPAPSL